MIDTAAPPAGRDLDAMIAERVFHWTRVEVGPDIDLQNRCEVLAPPGRVAGSFDYPPRGIVHLAYHVPSWSTAHDLFGLFNLIAELDARGWLIRIDRIRNTRGGAPSLYWRVDLQRGADSRLERASADAISLPHAAALAALATASAS